MHQNKLNTLPPLSESMTMNIVVSNLIPPDSNAVPTYSVCSYTIGEESTGRSAPLNEATVRLGNSLLSAVVPEAAIRYDGDEGL